MGGGRGCILDDNEPLVTRQGDRLKREQGTELHDRVQRGRVRSGVGVRVRVRVRGTDALCSVMYVSILSSFHYTDS